MVSRPGRTVIHHPARGRDTEILHFDFSEALMALTKQQKEKALNDLKDKISKQKSVVFADFSKVNSKDLFDLRKKLKEAGCLLKIGKKTLIRIAFGRAGVSFWDKIKKNVPGQMALILGIEDEVAPAKISYQFSKTNENFKILGGIFPAEGGSANGGERRYKFAEKEKVLALATLPSRNELLAKIVDSLSAPISGFENVLIGNTRSLVLVLSKIKK